ncbi:hypothetical protein GUITHDRAFT_114873 [Guillardia theta CCMP2712]|uniref:EGF-like domain-containing protein n=1 Tax=Guillardia theta (strain CCMP2712) TaxID=905079 RepID=L1IRX3_GUITC|nr:hypothetical protein GUITHDRAFT_114873 [Guillardia theta CCMP2712]EKX38993.1 hypothetical protein GUITHDRAFT_114873 [Guillardia theta CCMP2712]|eukprot:XP_005825973.1 hypothetical protein GUITHDRAFT_114873 [Guillardia theta CCMP2712]
MKQTRVLAIALTFLVFCLHTLHSLPYPYESNDGLRIHTVEGRFIAVENEQALNNSLRAPQASSTSEADLSEFLKFVLSELNPCIEGKHACDPHASCIPLVKDAAQRALEYICTCKAGWSGNGFYCENINECQVHGSDVNPLCESGMYCKDTMGSFECLNNHGFDGMDKGTIPVDVDECMQGSHNCHEHAQCHNVPGSFTCTCSLGYNGNGTTCWNMCHEAAPAQRINCFQDDTPSEETCVHRGCCWNPSADMPNTPCYYPLPANFYRLVSWTETSSGVLAVLDCDGEMRYGDGRGGGGTRPFHIGPFGSEICPLHLYVSFESEDHLQIRIFDASKPQSMIPPYFFPDRRTKEHKAEDRKYSVKYIGYPFGLIVQREPDGLVLFNSTPVPGRMNGLSFEPQFISLSTQLEEGTIFDGLGPASSTPYESKESLKTYLVWPSTSNQSTSSPFLLSLSKEQEAKFGLLMSNPHAMEVLFARDSLTFRMIGGEIDLRIFVGGGSKTIVKRLTDVVGKLEDLPPLWSLGMLVKLNSTTSSDNVGQEAENLMEMLDNQDIPYDGIVVDVRDFSDYSENELYSKNLGRSDKNFARKVSDMSVHVRGRGKKLITAVYPSSLTLEDAIIRDKFNKPVRGKMKGEDVFYLDFFNPNITRTWGDRLERLSKIIEFDGIMLESFQPENECNGICLETCDRLNKFDSTEKATCSRSFQTERRRDHYSLHNLYEMSAAFVSYQVLSDLLPSRPLILSRSDAPGIGQWATVMDDMKSQDFSSTLSRLVSSAISLTSYIYTCVYFSHTTGVPVIRPLHMEFSMAGDESKKEEVANNIMFVLGSSILVVANLNMEGSSISVQLPSQRWYNLNSGLEEKRSGAGAGAGAGAEGAGKIVLSAKLGILPVAIMLLKGGSVLSLQFPATNMNDKSESPFVFVCAPDEAGKGAGDLYLDDGKSQKNVLNGRFNLLRSNCFVDGKNQLGNFTLQSLKRDSASQPGPMRSEIRKIVIFGASFHHPAQLVVRVNGHTMSNKRIYYEETRSILHIDLFRASSQAGERETEERKEDLYVKKPEERGREGKEEERGRQGDRRVDTIAPWDWMEPREEKGKAGMQGEEGEGKLDVLNDLHVDWRIEM